jgi:two-component system, NtrC family, nitrogen regulation response regulator GlnG
VVEVTHGVSTSESVMPVSVTSVNTTTGGVVQSADFASPVTATAVTTPTNLHGHEGEIDWVERMALEASKLLAQDRQDVWDVLTRKFESQLIRSALQSTRGRRIEAATKLGIGRNTITRKIQELGLDD